MTDRRRATLPRSAALYSLPVLVFNAIGPRVFASEWLYAAEQTPSQEMKVR